ncbi:MAG: hypothetical protein LBW85_09665 [Deltaproteobacteria bacterium]|jgi:hypothetical protein|nr:hypothetical protein [Deltaproteobacteria bacterium]
MAVEAGFATGMAAEVVEACRERREAEPGRRHLGMSSVGHPCARKTWLGMNAPAGSGTGIDGKLARIFDMGLAVEARMLRDLRLRWKVTDEQAECSDFGGWFRGHADGILRGATPEPMLLEIKSANDAAFRKFRSAGISCRPEYEAQVLLYMHYLGLPRALFAVENKNTQALHFQIVEADPGKAGLLREKALRLLRADTAPPKLKKVIVSGREQDAGDCWWCEWRAGMCPRADDAEEPLCGRCARFVSRFRLMEAGADSPSGLCLLTDSPADRLGSCGSFEPR